MPSLEAQEIFDPHVPSRVMEKAPLLLRDAAWVLPPPFLQFQATLQVENSKRSFQSEFFEETVYLVGSAIPFSGQVLSSPLYP